MADERVFTLVGKFDDKITPSLRKLDTSLKSLSKSFDKMQRGLRPISKELGIMAAASQRVGQNFANQRSSIDNAVRGLTQYRKEMGKAVAAQEKLSKRVKMPVFDGGGGGGGGRPRGGRGGGGRPRPMDMGTGDGYSIDKGIIAGLATNMITGIFDQIGGAVGKAVNFVKGALQERIDDEMGDIQSAGGILSIGKEFKVPWADTYQEAFDIQKKLNGEMANLAAALPGETGQYVSNMKQVTDTVMKVTQSNGPAMIEAMKKFNSSVTDTKGAYIEATKQLAKFTTLASLGQTGGMPLTALAEQMLNSDKVNVKSLKTKFTALRSNPLVSGALEKYEAEMNKAGAGSAERYSAMIRAFEQAFPVEVLDAMTNSADGIIQGLKSGLLNPDTGLLGLGRAIKVNFAGLNRKMGPVMEELSVFDMFLGMFKAFGMVLGPIVSELPKIIEPFSSLMNPLKEFYVLAENTVSNFKGATKGFADKKLDFAPFRGSLMAIGKLAKALGADEGQFQKLEGMLSGKKLDFGAALKQAMTVLFSSDALNKFGRAIGEALGGFLSMLAGIAKTGDEMVNSSGLASGFMQGWNASGGSAAISEIVNMIVSGIIKALLAVSWEALTTDPVGVAVLATVFVGPVRTAVFGFFGRILTNLGIALANANLGGLIAGWAGPIMATIKSIGLAVSGFFSSILTALAPLVAPLLIIGAIVAGIYIFRDQILSGITSLQTWITSNFSGPIRDVLLGVTKVWQGVVNMVAGLVDTIWGFFSGDKVRLSQGMTSITTGFNQWLNGIKQVFFNLSGAVGQFASGAGNLVNTYVIAPIGQAFLYLGSLIGQGFMSLVGLVQAYIISPIVGIFNQIRSGVSTAASVILAAWSAFVNTLKGVFQNLGNLAGAARSIIGNAVMSGIQSLGNAIKGALLNAVNFIKNLKGPDGPGGNAGKPGGRSSRAKAGAKGSDNLYSGSLGQAINYEMANKPSGSDLVIANSSETIIPAFNGLNLGNLTASAAAEGMNTAGGFAAVVSATHNAAQSTANVFASGFQTFSQRLFAGQQATVGAINKGTQVGAAQSMMLLSRLSSQNAALMSKMNAVAAAKGMSGEGGFGGNLGGGKGGLSSAASMARSMGLTMTSAKRSGPANASYHNVGRAMDFSNSTGPTPQMMKFAQTLSAQHGSSMAELIYTPLGYSIKHGKKIPPIAKAGHYNHVHVAYSLGSGNPAFFDSAAAADHWESKMAKGSPIVSSVRARANEMQGGGGAMTINAPITINQQPGQSGEELAAMVAIKLTAAVNELRYSSYKV